MDQLPRLGKRELICLLLFTCSYVVSVWRGFLFLWVLGMGYVISLWHSLSLPYNYFTFQRSTNKLSNGDQVEAVSQREALFNFIEFLNVKNTSVLVGYNVSMFDIPILVNRLREFSLL